jgi:CRISPR-associated endonuclease/helicase Cas3
MKPLHAGLLGVDVLWLFDEAHLSQAFVRTVRETRLFQPRVSSAEGNGSALFQTVTLSATQTTQSPFGLEEDDISDPVLGRRLRATKYAELVAVPGNAMDGAFTEALAERAWRMSRAGGGGGAVVAVVVNRVARARIVFEGLLAKGARPFHPTGDDGDVPALAALLTGCVRDLDRDDLLKRVLPLVHAGRNDQEAGTPLFIVATQCIEVGADLDFDALVTEVAPLDSLRQRFGRLNRLGRPIEPSAAIMAAADQISKNAEDPVYGEAIRKTWEFMSEKSETRGKGKMARRVLDFGITGAQSWLPRSPREIAELLTDTLDPPVLLPRDIDSWTRTSPIPAVDPEIPLYLHGAGDLSADVEIIWRADLDDDAASDEIRAATWKERVGVCPPSSLEALPLPVAEARRWLRRTAAADITDEEASPEEDEEGTTRGQDALRWCGAEDSRTQLVRAWELRPGDLIVVPSTRGGCDPWGWAPQSRDLVRDRAREANLAQRQRDILRLSRASPELELDASGERSFAHKLADLTDTQVVKELKETIGEHLEAPDGAGPWSGNPRVLRSSAGGPLAIERRQKRRPSGTAVTEDDESARAAQRPISLAKHSHGVESYARGFAAKAGLPGELVDDIALAGFLHDAGKAHPAFKRLLYGGDELAAVAGPDLAKSAKLPDSARDWQQARRRAGCPKGARHEVASLRFAEAHPRFVAAHDPELVLWLVGTHHGYGRPFFPAVEWPAGGESFATDLGDGRYDAKPALSLSALTAVWVDLFDRLKIRYGAWGLARLEAVLRLADHRRSEAEQQEAET